MGSIYSSPLVPQYKAMQTVKNVMQDSKPTCGWRTSWKYGYLTEEVPGVLYDLPLVNEERGHDHHPAHITTSHHSLAAAVCFRPNDGFVCSIISQTWMISITANIRWRLSWYPSVHSIGHISYGMCYLSCFSLQQLLLPHKLLYTPTFSILCF